MPPPPRHKLARPGARKPAVTSRAGGIAAAIQHAPQSLDDATGVELGDPSEVMEVDQESIDAKAWINERVESELTRVKATGVNVTSLPVKNFGIVVDLSRKKPVAINRIEIDSTFDFKQIQQIMVSPSIPYPHKTNFEYVNVILLTANQEDTPMLIPYLYDTKFKTQEPLPENDDSKTSAAPAGRKSSEEKEQRPWINVKNNLTEWLLVNNQHQRARHHIDEFHDV
ncbi:hypothetical protein DFQ27_005655 [Actinomortierella ambigua]|uniref:Uncharacterized protein n=1 Tax=Actinomortierella ambigua TaxID=1343610 RepID=A0A9P6U2B5_9FUNG|nr:hypothetical protein DFQ27_005655 [Actinomortierella ambigua]